ncbi:Bug family tripartite tricarboxylate transporter substrate binding protein [Rhodoplanes sp. Z2-YC6860]|uniref:Bug family tripartite tricarboxylate transporter substrate binding protein n=1 Tax=Rhodoplanes sp. Z2-YC6860 TaxID=674703 RepID=UPI00078ECA0B|nr:tripartite tricarboxylate transporter substrate binding protein [Rhodoplanes sp. Z2-YC6860]AMN43555.1 extra-cytoplasmic solute receptor protein [Rhodoplanes sp. Z2-YC6860]
MLASLFSTMRALLPATLMSVVALSCNAAPASAETFPSRSVRVVVAAPPGGLTDVVARSVSQFLQEKLGQPFIVENIAGASSTIGATQVARSAPDGYTLLVNPSLFVITPMLMNVPYDVVKDFTPISNFGTVPIAIGVNPALPAKNLKEFIALAKANPDKMTWGAEGVGSVGHLTMERLQREAGFKILIVHYKGTSPALIDLIAGRVSAMITPVPNMIEQFRSGAVRPLAVATKARVSALPDVPTIEEQGFPNFEIGSWYGLWGPANMPKDVVSVLNQAIAEAMKTPRVTERLAAQGLIPVGSSSADFAAFANAEIAKFGKMIKDADIKIGN